MCYYSACTKPGKWVVVYVGVSDIDLVPLSMILIFDFGIVPTVWYCFVFTISFVANIGEKGLILDQCMTISV
jgi:hypothetical protein